MDSKNSTMYEYAQSQFADGAFIYPESKMLSISALSLVLSSMLLGRMENKRAYQILSAYLKGKLMGDP